MFRRLHRRVTEKKLSLFEFTSSSMAEPSAGTTKVMRGEMVHADPLGILLYGCPNNIRSDSSAQLAPVLPDSPEDQSFTHPGSAKPSVD